MLEKYTWATCSDGLQLQSTDSNVPKDSGDASSLLNVSSMGTIRTGHRKGTEMIVEDQANHDFVLQTAGRGGERHTHSHAETNLHEGIYYALSHACNHSPNSKRLGGV